MGRIAGMQLSFVLVSALVSPTLSSAEMQEDRLDPHLAGSLAAASAEIEFGEAVPNSVVRLVTVPDGQCADLEIFARDCCIRDDVVVVFVAGNQVATIDSRGGPRGSHPGETHTLSVGPGTHLVEYVLMSDNVGPSGWVVSETVKPGTGQFPLGGVVQKPPLFALFGEQRCAPDTIDEFLGKINDDAGNELELRCVNGAFALRLNPGTGPALANPIGICPYGKGLNFGTLFHIGDTAPSNGIPDCFLRTTWFSGDQLRPNDGGPAGDDDGDGKQDAHQVVFDILGLIGESRHFEDDKLAHTLPCASGCQVADPNAPFSPLELPLRVQAAAVLADDDMTLELKRPCDLDLNEVCDASDRALFESAVGASLTDPNYLPLADFDGDGVITDRDRDFIGFGEPVPVDSSTEVRFSGIAHDRRRQISKVNAFVTNTSAEVISQPLFLVIESISDPFVVLLTTHGTTSDGKPFVDISPAVPGTALDPDEVTGAVTLSFTNPLLRRFAIRTTVRTQVLTNP